MRERTLWESQRPALRGAESHIRLHPEPQGLELTRSLPSRKGSEQLPENPHRSPHISCNSVQRPTFPGGSIFLQMALPVLSTLQAQTLKFPEVTAHPQPQKQCSEHLGPSLGLRFRTTPCAHSLHCETDTVSISTVRWTQYPEFYLPFQGDACQSHLSIYPGQWPVDSEASVHHPCVVAFARLLQTMGSGRKRRLFLSDPRPTSGFECWTPGSPSGWSRRRQNHCPGGKRPESGDRN